MENNKDFEQFLKQNANQYRMYPSEKVWKGIYYAIHGRRRWIGFGLALLALTVVSVTWIMLSSPSPSLSSNNKAIGNTVIEKAPSPTSVNEKNTPTPEAISTIFKPAKNTNPLLAFLDDHSESFSTPDNSNILSEVSIAENGQEESPINEIKAYVQKNNTSIVEKEVQEVASPQSFFITSQPIDNNPDLTVNKSEFKNENEEKTIVPSFPWTIESVTNSFRASAKRKVLLQAYIAPTISYRKLSENKSFLNAAALMNNPSIAFGVLDVNKAVTHKPAIGLELGLTAKYPLSRMINIKAGLQLNVSRYDIKAFTYNGEVATIALDDGTGVNSLYRWTNYRNYSGYSSNWLQNFYFSASIPIGVEVKIARNKKTSFGVAGSIQPTYVLRDKAYLLSTDYKNYARVPWLIRKWNANTSIETFVNYSSGRIKWQVGPQVRYQLLSSFQDKYPVKENLFDFGLKVGIMLNQ